MEYAAPAIKINAEIYTQHVEPSKRVELTH